MGVPFGAGMPQIRRAYRQLVLLYHPDRNQDPTAPDMFLRIQAAYEYLQRFQELASAGPVSPTAPPPPKPQSDWEKYQFVYEPPKDPKEYIAWVAVARERARRQKEKDEAEYIRRTLALKQKWWFQLARLASYLVVVLGHFTGIMFILLPGYFLLTGRERPALLGIFMIPMGIKIIGVMRDLRQDIRRHFGEDLTPPAK